MEQSKLAAMPMPRLVADMSLPLMFSLLIQSLYNIVDGIFVARLSEDALTATSLAFPVHILMIAVGVGTSVGVNSLLSRSIGAKDEETTGKAAAAGVVLSLISTAVFALFGLLCTDLFVSAFTQDEQIALYSRQYMLVCTVFCAGSFVSTMYQRFLQAAGDAVGSMISLLAGALTNIALDPVLIFGLFGLPRMEVLGAAVATVTGQWVCAAAAIALNRARNPVVKVRLRGFCLEKSVVGRIFRVGLPTIVTQAAGSVMVSLVNGILMPFSSTAVAFFGIYYKLQSFLFMPMNGLGQALIPIVGYSFGAKRYDRVKEAVRTALPAAAGIALAGTAVFLLFPRQLLGLFGPSAELLELGAPALRIISVTFVLTAVTIIFGYAASGLGSGMVNMVGTVLRQLVLFVPLCALFARLFGVERVWYAMWIAEAAAAAYAALAIRWVMKRQIPEEK